MHGTTIKIEVKQFKCALHAHLSKKTFCQTVSVLDIRYHETRRDFSCTQSIKLFCCVNMCLYNGQSNANLKVLCAAVTTAQV